MNRWRMFPLRMVRIILITHLSLTNALPAKVNTGTLLGRRCYDNYQCGINQWCYNRSCQLPCMTANLKCPYQSMCVVREHQPVCKYPYELAQEEAIRANGGCVTSADCYEHELCLYSTCTDACTLVDCNRDFDNAVCEVVNHYPTCFKKVDS